MTLEYEILFNHPENPALDFSVIREVEAPDESAAGGLKAASRAVADARRDYPETNGCRAFAALLTPIEGGSCSIQ